MTDFRALCAELLEAWDASAEDFDYDAFGNAAAGIVDRARIALAESEPEGPTLAEIDDLCAEHSFYYEDSESLECLLLIITDALARWGCPAPQPIPVSERIRYEFSVVDGDYVEQAGGTAPSYGQAVKVDAALAEPEPEGPTDEELLGSLPISLFGDVLYQPGSLPSDWGDTDEYIASPGALLVFARTVLARWRRPTSLPIPVSERLPGPQDCDAWEWNCPFSNMWCWWWDDTESVWIRDEADTPRPSYLTHWLPAHALPLPSGEVSDD